MNSINITPDTPLQSDEKALVVFVITDSTGVVGVYPSPERAIQYIENWLAAGDPPQSKITSIKRKDEYVIEILIDGVDMHEITKTHFQL